MYGAIIGDLAGSIYEYKQLKEVKSIYMDKVIPSNAFYSDDTILTIAILDAIKNNLDYGKCLKKYINDYRDYKPDFEPYFKTPFSPQLIKWAEGSSQGVSRGNGAMMRISPVGFMFNLESDVIKHARLATIPSHNSSEAIECATIIALLIYYLRMGKSIEWAFKKLNLVPSYKPFTKFNTTCYETLNNCLYVIYNSDSFLDAIKKTLDMGGDTDTNCAIVGSVAEALYGISDTLKEEVLERIPDSFVRVLKK